MVENVYCNNLCRLKPSNVKLESGEVGWSNKLDGTEGLLDV